MTTPIGAPDSIAPIATPEADNPKKRRKYFFRTDAPWKSAYTGSSLRTIKENEILGTVSVGLNKKQK